MTNEKVVQIIQAVLAVDRAQDAVLIAQWDVNFFESRDRKAGSVSAPSAEARTRLYEREKAAAIAMERFHLIMGSSDVV